MSERERSAATHLVRHVVSEPVERHGTKKACRTLFQPHQAVRLPTSPPLAVRIHRMHVRKRTNIQNATPIGHEKRTAADTPQPRHRHA